MKSSREKAQRCRFASNKHGVSDLHSDCIYETLKSDIIVSIEDVVDLLIGVGKIALIIDRKDIYGFDDIISMTPAFEIVFL